MRPEAMDARGRRPLNLKVLAVGTALAAALLLVLVMNLGRDPRAVRSPLVGKAAPAFTLKPLGGGAPIDLAALKGRPVVVNFWATWCVPCLQEHEALLAAARGAAGVQFFGIVYEDDEAKAAELLRQRGSAYPSLWDPDSRTAIAYGVFGVPETFFIDRGGRIVEKFAGPMDSETLAVLIRKTTENTP